MTWGETATAQLRCSQDLFAARALTSIELLAAAVIIRLVTMHENLLVQNARQSSTPPLAHVLASL